VSDDVMVIRELLERHLAVWKNWRPNRPPGVEQESSYARAIAALDSLERELITNERAANDLFLENESLRSVIREVLRLVEQVSSARWSPEMSRWVAHARAYLREVPA
jgi:hypothetical protein